LDYLPCPRGEEEEKKKKRRRRSFRIFNRVFRDRRYRIDMLSWKERGRLGGRGG